MIRAAAKNHDYVAVVVDAEDYAGIIAELDANNGALSLATRRALAAKAYARTAVYDAAISNWFQNELARSKKPESAHRRNSSPSAASSSRACAMAKTRINGPRST